MHAMLTSPPAASMIIVICRKMSHCFSIDRTKSITLRRRISAVFPIQHPSEIRIRSSTSLKVAMARPMRTLMMMGRAMRARAKMRSQRMLGIRRRPRRPNPTKVAAMMTMTVKIKEAVPKRTDLTIN